MGASHHDIAFKAAEMEQGRPMVRLILSREGKASASATVFLFEPKEEMTSQPQSFWRGSQRVHCSFHDYATGPGRT